MSGETVVFDDRAGRLASLVRGIAYLENESLPRHALIGGIAVFARLGLAHRATADVDEVVLGDDADAVQILTDHGAERRANGVVLPDGTMIDLISVQTVDRDLLPDDPAGRAFILTHSYALTTATTLRLVATDGARQSADVTTHVATVSALVAMKLTAAPSRRGASLRKGASDVYDVYRLLVAHDAAGRVSAELREGGGDLVPLVRDYADEVLVREVRRSVRWLWTSGTPEMQSVTADDLRFVGVAFRDGLRG